MCFSTPARQPHLEFSLNPGARQRPCQWCLPTVGKPLPCGRRQPTAGGLSWSSIVQPTPEAGDDIVLGSGLHHTSPHPGGLGVTPSAWTIRVPSWPPPAGLALSQRGPACRRHQPAPALPAGDAMGRISCARWDGQPPHPGTHGAMVSCLIT
jgi:hypothetical protein